MALDIQGTYHSWAQEQLDAINQIMNATAAALKLRAARGLAYRPNTIYERKGR